MLDFLRNVCRPRTPDAFSKRWSALCTPILLSYFMSWCPLLPAQAAHVQTSQAEYEAYQNAMQQSTPEAKAAAFEAYLAEYPNSAVKIDALAQLGFQYSSSNARAKMIATADRLLQVDPDNYRGMIFEVDGHRANADDANDIVRKQQELDQAAGFAQRALSLRRPGDHEVNARRDAASSIFYSAIGAAALFRKDAATAIDAYRAELAFVPLSGTEVPGQALQDTYYLGMAYSIAPTPDYVHCAFYAARAAAYATAPDKIRFAKTAIDCYVKQHGAVPGYEAVEATAKANLNPPPGFTIEAAPTPADMVAQWLRTAGTGDFGGPVVIDREYALRYGRPDDAAKIWGPIKDKTVEIPDALVIESSATVLKVAVSDDAVQAKTADFLFNLRERSSSIPAVGSKVTVVGTYDSFSSNPFLITMRDGSIVSPAAHKRVIPAHR